MIKIVRKSEGRGKGTTYVALSLEFVFAQTTHRDAKVSASEPYLNSSEGVETSYLVFDTSQRYREEKSD